jgi:hypothetical protein
MLRNSITTGVLLILLAIGFFAATDAKTALTPLGPGIPILICGLIAMRGETARKHAMHVAMIFALLGVLAPLYPIVKGLANATVDGSVIESLLMLVICAVYLAMDIKSFIDARKAQQAQ